MDILKFIISLVREAFINGITNKFFDDPDGKLVISIEDEKRNNLETFI